MAPSDGDNEIPERFRDPGFTPAIRDLPALFGALESEDEELAKTIQRAVLRIEVRHHARVVSEAIERLETAKRPARARLVRLLGRIGGHDAHGATDAVRAAREWLREALDDADPKARHTAARALGKLRPDDLGERERIESALLGAWDRDGAGDRQALAESLGKYGSKAARERLASVVQGESDLTRRATRAGLMIGRAAARDELGAIHLTATAKMQVPIRFYARSGLEAIVRDELGATWKPMISSPGVVDAQLTGSLGTATAIRSALHVSFPMRPVPVRDDLAEAVVRAITGPSSLFILRTFTQQAGSAVASPGGLGAPIRFRLAWRQGGHRRALAWRCAELIAARTNELINDPTESTWEIMVDEQGGQVAIELIPRGFKDERFAYRTATVPASSHPTVAAALARLVPPRPVDVVWDPFVGAGAELVERARLGPYASLFGTDIEHAAIEAARGNLKAAGIEDATLACRDALTFDPKGVTLIITNPPMGRRVQRGTHGALLERFIDHAARVLVPGGALVWAVPDASLNAHAERAGLVLERAIPVDMGGFSAALSVHRKP